jgi:hypothetical protein
VRKTRRKKDPLSDKLLDECYIRGVMDGDAMLYQNEEGNYIFPLRPFQSFRFITHMTVWSRALCKYCFLSTLLIFSWVLHFNGTSQLDMTILNMEQVRNTVPFESVGPRLLNMDALAFSELG